MGVAYNPSVVTSGLSFYYDMGNREKSWINIPGKNQYGYDLNNGYLTTRVDGRATMNINSADAGWGHWGPTGIVGSFGVNTDSNFIWNKAHTYSHYWDCASNSTVNYLFYRVLPFDGQQFGSVVSGWGGGNPNNKERSFKFIFKRSDGGPINENIVGIAANAVTYYRPFGNGVNYSIRGSSPSSIAPWTSIKNLGDGWYECNAEHLMQNGTNDLAGVYLSPGYRLYVGHAQMEEAPTVSRRAFVGERSNTEAILDITGNNTIAINNLTYSNDGTFSFDGTDDYMSVTSTVNLGNPCTICAFFKLTGSNSDTVIYGPLANGNDNWFGVNGNKLYMYGTQSIDVNNFGIQGTTTLDTSGNVWYFACCTVNGATATLYLNGNQEATTTRTFTIGGWSSTASIGRRGSAAQRYFNGQIGAVFGYNAALTSDQIKQNYAALKGRFGA